MLMHACIELNGHQACSLRRQVPGVPRCKTSPNPKSRKKIARLAHLTPRSFGGRGEQIFSISSALDETGPGYCGK